MQVAYQVLRLIAGGEFHSGQALAKLCNVSRARIWQAIELLREYGLEIHAVSGKGYSLLNAIELLDKELILANMNQTCATRLSQVQVLNQTDSTNDFIKRGMNYMQPNHLVVAEGQVKGRGRMGRGWYSPLTKNIAMSFYTQLKVAPKDLPKLSLVVGICVMKALESLVGPFPGCGIKWPNDIWYNDAKLCGILTESMQAKEGALTPLIIGIGINTHKIDLPIEAKVTSIEEMTGRLISRNQLIARVMDELVVELKRFEQVGFAAMAQLWQHYDLLRGQQVVITEGEHQSHGLCEGINDLGALMVKQENSTKAYFNGEVQVRPYAVVS